MEFKTSHFAMVSFKQLRSICFRFPHTPLCASKAIVFCVVVAGFTGKYRPRVKDFQDNGSGVFVVQIFSKWLPDNNKGIFLIFFNFL